MNGKKFQLQYGYLHCVGRKTYVAGTADTKEEALDWVKSQTSSNRYKTRDPDDDPVHWCPVHHCHMKRQKPWFSWVEASPGDA